MAKFHHNTTNLPEPTPQPRRRKRVWTFVLIAILFVLASISAYLLFSSPPQSSPELAQNTQEKTQAVEIDAEGVSQNVLSWISTLSNETGYAIEERCTNESICSTPPSQITSASFVLYAFTSTQQNSPTPPELDIALSSTNRSTTYQPYSCSYAQKVFESGQFSSPENLVEICTSQTIPDPISQSSISTIVRQIQDLTRPLATSGTTIQDATQLESFLISNAAVQDAVALEDLAGKDTAELALSHYQDSLEIYKQTPNQVSSRVATLISATLTIYNQTNDTNFLDFAQFLFNKHYSDECNKLDQCTELINASDMLYMETGEDHYNEFRKRLINNTVENYFDSKGRKGFRFDKKAFYKIEEGEIVYPILENSILVSQINKNGQQ